VPGIAIVILLLVGGLALGVKGRAPGVSAWCAGLLVLFLVSTPVASGLPGAVSTAFSVIDGAMAPVLAGEQPGVGEGAEHGRRIGHDESGGEADERVRQVGVDR
jgi:hypothetical protein